MPELKEEIPPTEEVVTVLEEEISTVESTVQTAFESSDRFYSPLVRNIAKEEGISQAELDQIPGTGKDQRLTKTDLLNYIKNKPSLEKRPLAEETQAPQTKAATPPISERVPAQPSLGGGDQILEMSRMEKLISKHMKSSLETSAHVQSFIEVDVTDLWDWREGIKQSFLQREGEKITFTPIFMMLTAQVLRDFPLLNSSLSGNKIIQKREINLGMATALADGNLIVPVIKNADQLSLVGFTKRVNDLAKRARTGTLSPDDVTDGTYTVTNVGMFDSLMGTPIINQPQVGILALGAIRKVPAVVETDKGDFIGIRRKMILSHSYDHRIVNGAMGGLFIKELKNKIENWDVSQQV